MSSIARIGKYFAITGLILAAVATTSGTSFAIPYVTIIDTGEGAPTAIFDSDRFVGPGGIGTPIVTSGVDPITGVEFITIEGSSIVHGANPNGGMTSGTRNVNIRELTLDGPVSDTLSLLADPSAWTSDTVGYQNITLTFRSDTSGGSLTPLAAGDVLGNNLDVLEQGPPNYNVLTEDGTGLGGPLGVTCGCFSLVVQSDVPEPATLLLLGFGLAGVAAVSQKRHLRK